MQLSDKSVGCFHTQDCTKGKQAIPPNCEASPRLLHGKSATALIEQIVRCAAIRLTEWRLVEGAKFARMQRVAALAQQIERSETDLEMLGHRTLVEGVGGARQLDLAVKGLVRHAEQRALGHAKPVAVGRDRAALHVNGDRA